MHQAPARSALTVRFDSMTTTTAEDPRPLGVFVDWVEVEADGPIPFARSATASVLLVMLIVAGAVAAWDTGGLPPARGRWGRW